MRRAVICTVFFLSVASLCLAQERGSERMPSRIVSLSPSVTEILYALGLGDRVVGVTNYCGYPEDVNSKARIGGYLDTNYEAIILLEPDLVVVSTEYGNDTEHILRQAGIPYMIVSTQTTGDIFRTIREIAARNGAEKEAKRLIAELSKEILRLRRRVKNRSVRSIMVVVGRDEGALQNIYIAGRNTFYDELLTILNCKNVYKKADTRYPTVSLESILSMNPDIILEMRPHYPEDKIREAIADWGTLKELSAVKNKRVYVLNGDYVAIPGPRFPLILRDIADLL